MNDLLWEEYKQQYLKDIDLDNQSKYIKEDIIYFHSFKDFYNAKMVKTQYRN